MDTKKIVSDLLNTGMTQQQLADLVPCSQSAINAFLNGSRGSRVSLEIGRKLLSLHSDLCSAKTVRRSANRKT